MDKECTRSVFFQNSTNVKIKFGQISEPPVPMSVWLGIYPGPIVVDSNGNVIVADQVNKRIVKISPQGEASVMANLNMRNQVLDDYISAMAIDTQDRIYVVNDDLFEIEIIDKEGNQVKVIDYKDLPMYFSVRNSYTARFHPNGISVDKDGNIYLFRRGDEKSGGVLDRYGKLKATGVYVDYYGVGRKNHPDKEMVGYSGYYYQLSSGPTYEVFIKDFAGKQVASCNLKGIHPIEKSNYQVIYMDRYNDIYLINYNSLDIVQLRPKIKIANNQKTKVNTSYFIHRLYEDSGYRVVDEKAENIRILRSLSDSEIRIIRNAIFARYNYKFKDVNLTTYFSETFSDYRAELETVKLSDIDKENIQFFLKIERTDH